MHAGYWAELQVIKQGLGMNYVCLLEHEYRSLLCFGYNYLDVNVAFLCP